MKRQRRNTASSSRRNRKGTEKSPKLGQPETEDEEKELKRKPFTARPPRGAHREGDKPATRKNSG